MVDLVHARGELKRDYDRIVRARDGMAAREAHVSFLAKWRTLCPAVARSLEEAGEQLLTFYAFPKEHGVQQGEVVENKRLSEVMNLIKERQRERTEAKVSKPSTTLRKARLLRAGAHRRTSPGSSAEDRR